MNIPYSSRISCFTFILLLTAGCSTTSSGNWLEPRTANGPFKNILVIAVLPWAESRLVVEEQLVYSISEDGTQGFKSIYIEDELEEAAHTQANLTGMINKTSADAVLVLRFIDQDVAAAKTQSKVYYNVDGGGYIYGSYGNAWGYEVSRHETKQYLAAQIETDVELTLYDVADEGRPVYRLQVKNNFKNEGDSSTLYIAGDIADRTAIRLRLAGLIN